MQHERRLERQQNAAIQQAVGQQFFRRAQQHGYRFQQCKTDGGKNHTKDRRSHRQHTEQLICAFLVAGAQRHSDEGTAACADHEAEAAQHLDIRVDEVQRRERRFAREVRDKEAVHDGVNRRKDHHDNGRCREFQQPPRCKVIG